MWGFSPTAFLWLSACSFFSKLVSGLIGRAGMDPVKPPLCLLPPASWGKRRLLPLFSPFYHFRVIHKHLGNTQRKKKSRFRSDQPILMPGRVMGMIFLEACCDLITGAWSRQSLHLTFRAWAKGVAALAEESDSHLPTSQQGPTQAAPPFSSSLFFLSVCWALSGPPGFQAP